MRVKQRAGPLSVHATAGTHVVLLGINLREQNRAGLLGFAIERTDHTENERYWLRGFRTFADTEPHLTAGTSVSLREHPLQGFLWSDFTAKPDHRYTYRIVALRYPAGRIPMAAALVGFTVSATAITPRSFPSPAKNRGVFPCSASRSAVCLLSPSSTPCSSSSAALPARYSPP